MKRFSEEIAAMAVAAFLGTPSYAAPIEAMAGIAYVEGIANGVSFAAGGLRPGERAVVETIQKEHNLKLELGEKRDDYVSEADAAMKDNGQRQRAQSAVLSGESHKRVHWSPPATEQLHEVEFDVVLFMLRGRLSDYTVKCFADDAEVFYEISYESLPFAYAYPTGSQSLVFRIDADGSGVYSLECDSERDRSCLEERLIPDWVKQLQDDDR